MGRAEKEGVEGKEGRNNARRRGEENQGIADFMERRGVE